MNLQTIKNILLILIILDIISFLIELIGFNSITFSFVGLLIIIFTIVFLFSKQKHTQKVNLFELKTQKEIEISSEKEFMNVKSKMLQIIEILLIFSIIGILISIFFAV